jgi:hypothetical protein
LVRHADHLVKRPYLQPRNDALLCELAAVTKQFGGTVPAERSILRFDLGRFMR